MKIDLYCEGDCWDPRTWSGTPYELATTLKDLNMLNNAYNVHPYQKENALAYYLHTFPYLNITLKDVITVHDLYNVWPYQKKNALAYYLHIFTNFRIYKNGMWTLTGHHPRYRRELQGRTLEIYESNPKPESLITIGDLAIFNKTPYFTIQDLDINTVIKWKENKKATYMFDHIPMKYLKKREIFQKNVYENAAGILVASDWIKNNICSYLEEPEKVFVTGIGHRYSPIKLTDELIEARFENPVLLFVGKDGMRKGIDIAIKTFELMKSEFKNLKLKIVTNNKKLPPIIQNLTKTTPGIELYSNLSNEELTEMYTNSSLFIMPSKFEPFGKVFFEAMSFGLPVIGANCCAMPEFIIDGYNGYTPSHDPEEIKSKIALTFESFHTYKKLSINALNSSEKYNVKHTVKNILSIVKM